MSFDWQSYISLAKELIKHSSLYQNDSMQEACYRSAISRSYYGVFCIARNFLKKKGISIPKTDTHKFVREKYMNSSIKIEKKIGENLGRLWRERKVSDYEDTADIDIKRSETAIKLAKRVLKSLKQIRAI